MYDFTYHRPATIAEAVAKLGKAEDGKLLAGGQSLIPTLKQRLAQRSDLIDIGRIPGLAGIREEGGGVAIGAMTRHADVAGSALVRRLIPALADLAESIGDAQVRNLGTLGGSIANNDPSADYPGALLALNATVHTDRRAIGADDFFTGMFETALEPDEIVVSVSFPKPDRAAYVKFPNPASRYAIVGAFVARFGAKVRLAITGAGPTAFRHSGLEAALQTNFAPDAIDPVAIDLSDLNHDLHASREYRAHLIKVMTRRAVTAA